MSSDNIEPVSEGNQIDYQSDYFEEFSEGEDRRFRRLTGEGGYVAPAYATSSLATGRVEHPERFVEFWDRSLTKAMVKLHDQFNEGNSSAGETIGGPSIIFLTATRAIPYGFAIRQFWREAYPDEPQPRFQVVDSSSRRFGKDTTADQERVITAEEVARMRGAGLKYGFERTAIFDEYKNGGQTIEAARSILEEAGFEQPHLLLGRWGDALSMLTIPDEELPLFRYGSFEPTYRPLVWNAGVKSRALIADMKLVGHHMALEAKKRELVA